MQKKKLANPFVKKCEAEFRPQSSFSKPKKSASLVSEGYDTLQPQRESLVEPKRASVCSS
jgi:hypothetical protein